MDGFNLMSLTTRRWRPLAVRVSRPKPDRRALQEIGIEAAPFFDPLDASGIIRARAVPKE
jgi:hypothetical protein